MAGAAWGTAALWLATVSNERDLGNSPRLRWSIVLGLMLGLADAGYWLGSKYSLRDSPLYAGDGKPGRSQESDRHAHGAAIPRVISRGPSSLSAPASGNRP